VSIDKKTLSERDICTKYITPAIEKSGWDKLRQIREEVTFTAGRIYVRGHLTTRGKKKRADYILYYKPNIPIAIIEAKDNKHTVGAGMQQALEYADILDIPCVFSSNGDGFVFHDLTASGDVEKNLTNDEFPSPEEIWEKYRVYKGITTPEQEEIATQEYYYDGSGRTPRYYQEIAINRSVEAIAQGQDRILLVMATGTGKTYAAFQIIHRLWKAGAKKRILFLADRNALIDQTRRGDFRHFRDKMTVIKHRMADKAYEIYLALYQGLTGSEEEKNIYKNFSPDFFDLIVVDECHRGSAADDSAWKDILKYYKNATHIGLTATPRETREISNIEYFGDPIYTYSLKQGISDGFLAPYRVIRVGIDVDLEGWRPESGFTDKDGNPVEDRVYNSNDYDKNLVIDERRKIVAGKITEFLQGTDRFSKTIVFCRDIEHAEAMRQELANQNSDLVKENYKYVMRITGDEMEGKRELDNFIDPEVRHPVIATTSKLMTTGIDAQTCKLIVLDSNIRSMTEFKQIIGRGTRINEEYGKRYFTILDFRNVTDLFADSDFDGDPVRIKEISPEDDISSVEDEEMYNPQTLVDEETGEVLVDFEDISPEEPGSSYPTTDDLPPVEPPSVREKVFVNGIDVSILNERQMYFDQDGKPITMSLKDYTRQQLLNEYVSIDAFLQKWQESDRKEAIVKELEEHGVPVVELLKAVNRDCDLFDIICHVAYDMPPLTRKERADSVKKRNYFTKYGHTSRKVLEALLDKYADEGVEPIEDMGILRIQPFSEFGTPVEIIKEFGGKEQYLAAVKDLEKYIYGTDLAS